MAEPGERDAGGAAAEAAGTLSAPPALRAYLRTLYGDPSLEIVRHERLSGGAIQQNVALDLLVADGTRREALVLRTDAPSGVDVSLSRAEEHAILAAAFDAGVSVPEPLHLCTDASVSGRPFFLMRRVGGSANPVRLTREGNLDGAGGDALVEALGGELARVHAIPLDDPRLAFLREAAPDGTVEGGVLGARVAQYRRLLDELGARRPVLEWALAWLARQRLAPNPIRLCHHDFRTGNLMIEGTRVAGVLDWEFAAPGDPHEDIGWFCAPCWRFAARAREAGGLGPREAFYAGYERVAGRAIDRAAVPVWEIVATVRWAVIALQQGARFTSGAEPTLELGLTGRMVAELERDLLELVVRLGTGGEPPAPTGRATAMPAGARGAGTGAGFGDDTPAGDALLDAARATLLEELLPGLADERRYAALMVANAMGIAARELAASRPDRSDAAGAALCTRLRGDDVDGLFDATLLGELAGDVERRLRLANPKRLGAGA